MEYVLIIITIHGGLGVFDTLWNHEYLARLPQTLTAKKELKIHSYRAFLYGLTFIVIGLFEFNGIYAWLFFLVLIIEIFLTFWDFLEEDKSRKLPGIERITHTIMGMTGGAFLAYFLPELYGWSENETSIIRVDRGVYSFLLPFFGFGAFFWSVKDYLSQYKMMDT